MTDPGAPPLNLTDYAIHGVACAFLLAFAALFGWIVSLAYGALGGYIAGGLLALSMVTRYLSRIGEQDD